MHRSKITITSVREPPSFISTMVLTTGYVLMPDWSTIRTRWVEEGIEFLDQAVDSISRSQAGGIGKEGSRSAPVENHQGVS